MKCLVCDFGGSSVKYAVVDDNAVLTNNGSAPAPLNNIDEFVEVIGQLYDQYKEEVDGIALSLPGVIDVDTGMHLGSGAYDGILKGVNVREIVKARCGVNVSLENDGKCGALAEAWKGKLADVKDGAVIILGSGVGGGVIKDGKIHRGKNFTAGEFSFIITGRDYNIGSAAWLSVGMFGVTYRACKEKNLDFTVQDAPEVIAMLDTVLGSHYPSYDAPPAKIKADGKQIFKWLEEGDPAIQRVYDSFLTSLAILVCNIQVIYAPERIVIGGGLSLADRLIPNLRTEIQKICDADNIAPNMRAEIVRSDYLKEVNLLGAMYHYLQQYAE